MSDWVYKMDKPYHRYFLSLYPDNSKENGCHSAVTQPKKRKNMKISNAWFNFCEDSATSFMYPSEKACSDMTSVAVHQGLISYDCSHLKGILKISKEEIEEFLNKKGLKLFAENIDKKKIIVQQHFVSDDTYCSFFYSKSSDGISTFNLNSLNEKTFNEIYDFICVDNMNYSESSENGTVYVLRRTQTGVDIIPLSKSGGKELEKENYSKEVVEGFDFIISEFEKEEPQGRLVLLQGPPGTGKSYFIRGLAKGVKNTLFIVIQADQITALTDPSFLPSIIDLKADMDVEGPDDQEVDHSITLIVEDADSILMPRGADNINPLSTLLNFTDGLLESSLNLRLVCSTNADMDTFDDAVTRPGRLLRHIKIDRLPFDQSCQIIKRLNKDANIDKLKDQEYSLAECYEISKNGKLTSKKSKKVGF